MISKTDPHDCLYQEELEYKLEHSFDDLIDKIDDEYLFDHVINIHRKNYCLP